LADTSRSGVRMSDTRREPKGWVFPSLAQQDLHHRVTKLLDRVNFDLTNAFG
jgi:hypothetical protein